MKNTNNTSNNNNGWNFVRSSNRGPTLSQSTPPSFQTNNQFETLNDLQSGPCTSEQAAAITNTIPAKRRHAKRRKSKPNSANSTEGRIIIIIYKYIYIYIGATFNTTVIRQDGFTKSC